MTGKLEFDESEEKEFVVARDDLLGRFTAWSRRNMDVGDDAAEELASNARLALDWKWNYADGRLVRWTPGDVGEFLLEWCPRKLSVSPEDALTIPPTLGAFLAFLDDEGLLLPRSSLGRLASAVLAAAEEFPSAMADRSKFGMAKSLFSAALGDGVDVEDAEGLQAWMGRFNDLPPDERARLLSGPPVPQPARAKLPPIPLPTEDEVAASMAAAPIMRMLADFATYVGPGRKLTQKGNLTLADARELVELLGTNDLMEEVVGDHEFRITTSADLLGLNQVFTWAKKAGVVRVVHGKVSATKRGLGLAADPVGSFDRVIDALFAIGPLSSQRQANGLFAWPEVTEFLDEVSCILLAGPCATLQPMAMEDVIELATDAVHDTFSFGMTDEIVDRMVARDVTDIVDALERAGLVRRAGTEPAERGRRTMGGVVEITPAGVMTTRRLLSARGYETPVAGTHAGASAAELLLATDGDGFDVFVGEVLAWRRARSPERAAEEMAGALSELDDPALKNLALAVLGDIGVDIAAPHVRAAATHPAARGFALCWLVDHGIAGSNELYDPDDPFSFVDVLAYRMATSGPEALLATFDLAGRPDEQVHLLERLWRAPSTATEAVLDGIGRAHPSRVVAKAARKAAFKRRSWSATSSEGRPDGS